MQLTPIQTTNVVPTSDGMWLIPSSNRVIIWL